MDFKCLRENSESSYSFGFCCYINRFYGFCYFQQGFEMKNLSPCVWIVFLLIISFWTVKFEEKLSSHAGICYSDVRISLDNGWHYSVVTKSGDFRLFPLLQRGGGRSMTLILRLPQFHVSIYLRTLPNLNLNLQQNQEFSTKTHFPRRKFIIY